MTEPDDIIADWKRYTLLFILSCFILLPSCREKKGKTESSSSSIFTPDKFDEDDFAEALLVHYGENRISDTAWNRKLVRVEQLVQFTYQSNDYLPLWVTEAGNTDLAEALLKDIEGLADDGINTRRYNVDSLPAVISRLKGKDDLALAEIVMLDTLCTRAYIQASKDLLIGTVNYKRADSLWYHTNDSLWRPDSLLLTTIPVDQKYPGLDTFRSRLKIYTLLRDELKRCRQLAIDSNYLRKKEAIAIKQTDSLLFDIIRMELPQSAQQYGDTVGEKTGLVTAYQIYFGLKLTGKVDEATQLYLVRQPDTVIQVIKANLERTRWLPQQFEQDYILVNIPTMELQLIHNGQQAMHMNVIVGKNARQTPAVNSKMVNIVINPPWGVPPTIMKNDVLPGMQKSGRRYLDKKGLQIYDFKGNKVDPSQVNASNYKRFVFRQPPGDDNALGYVKFNMPNIWNIYLHDTPHRGDFNKSDRALSSGCIRVQYPREMAEYILATMNEKRFTQGRLDTIIKTQKTRYETMSNRPMVHIVYLTAWEDATSNIRFLRDFYKRDAKLIALLED